MPKTVSIDDNVHLRVVRKRMKISEDYKINLKISDIVNKILDRYIDNVEEVFGINRENANQTIEKETKKGE